jgi:hypothetical protein
LLVFVPDLVLLSLLCLVTGGLYSVYLPVFFIYASLGFYALERQIDVYALTGFTVIGIAACAYLSSYPGIGRLAAYILPSDVRVDMTNNPSLYTYAAVTILNLGFAAYVSFVMSTSTESLRLRMGALYPYLFQLTNNDEDKTKGVLHELLGHLQQVGCRQNVDVVQPDVGAPSLALRLRLRKGLDQGKPREIVLRAYNLAAEKIQSILDLDDAQRLWVNLIFTFSTWKDMGDISGDSCLDYDSRNCYINCTRENFESAMADPSVRRDWLALMPYCLRPAQCETRARIQCPQYHAPGTLCLATTEGERVKPDSCMAYDCYRTFNDKGLYARFICDDKLDIPRCVREFKEDRQHDLKGVVVVCCPKALVKNQTWFVDEEHGYRGVPVVFLSIAGYELCKYYVRYSEKASDPTDGLQTLFQIGKITRLFE